ncbi:hypothetical protein PoB_001483300 [Plakobranchus ocellatus]|uniref:ShKT domain-containing protein n=1 Tax=Plakobranchus ocellatus TaxID=259542 RepID=A0AAV3Z1D6_9GAST|nr:hypothetical protein PoB_001483300 [Plakobranchus ocellatus]
MHMNGHDHRCFDACCDDAACVSDLLKEGSQELNTLWTRLNGNCSDQLAADQCKQLMGEADVCHDRLAMSICPESCGLCGALESHVCEDTVLNGGCQNLKDAEDVCSDKLAVFICPKTCNMCGTDLQSLDRVPPPASWPDDELLDSIITSLIEGTSNSQSVPASLLPPSANPSDFPTFDCEELNTVSCGVLDGLCSSSFVSVVCPDHCKKCSSPIQVSNVTDAQSAPMTTKGMQVDTSMMPVTVDQEMSTTMQATAAMTTGDTAPPMVDTTTAPACSDHLNGMDCSALPNVCGSVMALSVCPKYCGLC